jgi:hypothetical protein
MFAISLAQAIRNSIESPVVSTTGLYLHPSIIISLEMSKFLRPKAG